MLGGLLDEQRLHGNLQLLGNSTIEPQRTAEPPARQLEPWLGLASLLWVLPLWATPFLPMVDYPQQLAAASIVRFYGDPARRLQEAYQLSLGRPHGLFEMLVAGLARLLPIETAGRLVVALALAAVLPAAIALCRRTGRPSWYALLALAVTYGHAFYWGFVDSLLAVPLLLGGLALADAHFERRLTAASWLLLAGWGLLFYTTHLQFLLLFAGGVAWLALARRPSFRTWMLQVSSVLPGLALGMGVLGWAHLHAAEVMTAFQQRLTARPTVFLPPLEALRRIPENLFGAYAGGAQVVLALLLAGVALLLARRSDAEGDDRLFRSRFAVLAAGVGLLCFVLPQFHDGYLMSERLVAIAVMLAVPALPCPSSPRRLRLAALLTAALLVLQLGLTWTGFLRFAAETAGLRELLDTTEPGQTLAGLIYEPIPSEWSWPPVLLHFPAWYQVEKGGRVLFSFAQYFNSPVSYRPGANWEDGVLAEWDEWNPRKFVYPRHAAWFRYFLVRGGPETLAAAFGPYLAETKVRQAGRWYLVERPAGMVQATAE